MSLSDDDDDAHSKIFETNFGKVIYKKCGFKA
jgi:hypothetical protein